MKGGRRDYLKLTNDCLLTRFQYHVKFDSQDFDVVDACAAAVYVPPSGNGKDERRERKVAFEKEVH